MSFFSSIQEMVQSGVAGLTLSPKRFSFSRSDSTGGNGSGNGTEPPSPRGSTDAGAPVGFPRVLPSPGVEALPQSMGLRRRSTLEAPQTVIPTANAPLQRQRGGSFRRQPPQNTDASQADFYIRRPSWPDVDVEAVSGVHEMDGSYFENLNGVGWEQETRRETARRDFKASFGDAKPPSTGLSNSGTADDFLSTKERDQLYVDMLYTIANAVGAPVKSDVNYKEELYLYGQQAFGVNSDHHYRMLHAAGEEKPPIVVLSVVVVEAEGLEAKDANGFSDPYCMLGIQPVSPVTQQSAVVNRALSESSASYNYINQPSASHPELRKHHSFRLSFKRRDGSVTPVDRVENNPILGHRTMPTPRVQQVGVSVQLPAKFIRATSVRPHTLNPRWNEKFRFDIDDVESDSLHLDIWDHDDESSVLEAVSKLNEVRGVRGLGRFFKQVCQSARQSSQDDFLGCVTVPLRDIPCTGLDAWFKLEARSHRSTVQGRIHLKMWLSTREDRGASEEDNWEEMLQHERLIRLFLRYEALTNGTCTLPLPAMTILRQHAAQADLSELQRASAFLAAHINASSPAPALLGALNDLHKAWSIPLMPTDPSLTREQQSWIAESFTKLLERSLQQIRRHRQLFCGNQASSLEPLLQSLSTLAGMPAFTQCCPFNKEIRSEIVVAIRKGTTEWFSSLHVATVLTGEPERSLVCLCTALHVELEACLEIYHPLFESINGINYFNMVYKITDKMLTEEVLKYLEQHGGDFSGGRWALLEPEISAITSTFALYLELRDFGCLATQLGANLIHQSSDGHRQLHVASNCHEWFEPAVTRWITAIKPRALQRVRNAWRVARVISPASNTETAPDPRFVRHSTVGIDVARLLGILRDFWLVLQWPANQSAVALLGLLLDIVSCCTALHADLTRQKLEETGYFGKTGPFVLSENMCVAVNDLEYACQCVFNMEQSIEPQFFDTCDTSRAFFERSQISLETRIDEALSRCGPQMHDALRKAAFHLAWSPDSLPTVQAITQMLEYLHVHLVAFNKSLLPRNFQRVLLNIWEAVILSLNEQADAGSGASSDTPSEFWPRLADALDLLARWFTRAQANHDNNQISNQINIHTKSFLRLEQRLRYHRTDTETLIDAFHCQRLQDQILTQQQQAPGPYGTLSVRTYFNHDSLCVEILHARDIIPLDPNGFSDPFVIIELLPKRLFPRCTEQQTHVHKKTLNPLFDECFEFSVTLESCRDPSAMLVFTVMDHDVLTANDFAGEAFLALNTIPGVADTGSSIDNFHGLKQIDLVLIQQFDKCHPILQILETRPNDKAAIDFIKKQKMRLSANAQ